MALKGDPDYDEYSKASSRLVEIEDKDRLKNRPEYSDRIQTGRVYETYLNLEKPPMFMMRVVTLGYLTSGKKLPRQ